MSPEQPRQRPEAAAIEAVLAAYLEFVDGGGEAEQFLAEHPDTAPLLRDLVDFQDTLAIDVAPPSPEAMSKAKRQMHNRLRIRRLQRVIGRLPFRRPSLWFIAGSLGIGLSFGVAFAQEPGRVISPFTAVVEHLPLATGARGPSLAFEQELPLIPTPSPGSSAGALTATPQPPLTPTPALAIATVTPSPIRPLANTGAPQDAATPRATSTPLSDQATAGDFEPSPPPAETPVRTPTERPTVASDAASPTPSAVATRATPVAPALTATLVTPRQTPQLLTPAPQRTPFPTATAPSDTPTPAPTVAPTQTPTGVPTRVVTQVPTSTPNQGAFTPSPTTEPIVIGTLDARTTKETREPGNCSDDSSSPGTPGTDSLIANPTEQVGQTPCPNAEETPTPTPDAPHAPEGAFPSSTPDPPSSKDSNPTPKASPSDPTSTPDNPVVKDSPDAEARRLRYPG